ncbi:MAG: glycosyl hydrolase 53 family protein [Pseudomonadota bacterium]
MAQTRRNLLLALFMLTSAPATAEWRGVDLSYVNELEDCGAVYRDSDGPVDPYFLFARAGANLVRLRLWVAPEWTDYSNLEDVRRSMKRARDAGMQVLLDFHYSNDWAHPGKQLRPTAWPPADDVDALARQLAAYARETLQTLEQSVGLPDIVSVGNEINTNLLVDEEEAEAAEIDWPRNARLLNAGIRAVREAAEASGQPMDVMLHIAQPENVQPWFDDALAYGVTDFDVIGISYYPKWSQLPLSELRSVLGGLGKRYDRRFAIVETAYPWTLEGVDEANNILGADSLVDGYPATPDGQAAFLAALRLSVARAGGEGVIYWEPAWVSSSCETRWGKGSHWENATLLDFEHRLLPGAKALLDP